MDLGSVLITGGAGYLGSHAALALLPERRVVVLDNLSRGHRRLVPAGAEFVESDISDTDRLASVLRERNVGAVLHFAAFAYVGESMGEPSLYFRNNAAGTLSVLEAMRRADVRRLVFSSSCTVYGLPQTPLIGEDHRLEPISPYGRSKLMGEQFLPWYEQAYGLRWSVLRYFNAAGCDRFGRSGEIHDPEPHVIPRLLLAAAGGIRYFGILGDHHPTADGTCVRDYVHVTDLADAHRRALQWLEAGQPSQVLNLGAGAGVSVRELVAEARRVTGRPIPVRVEPARLGDPPSLIADARRAQATLGWRARHSDLGTILDSAWRWRQGLLGQVASAQSAGL